MAAKKSNFTAKGSVKRRTLNQTGNIQQSIGAPFNDQDAKGRLGNFTGAGEHSLVGGRSGIVGQTKQKFQTDKKSAKSGTAKKGSAYKAGAVKKGAATAKPVGRKSTAPKSGATKSKSSGR